MSFVAIFRVVKLCFQRRMCMPKAEAAGSGRDRAACRKTMAELLISICNGRHHQ